MDYPATFEIRVKGHLTERWSEWFGGLAIRHDAEGETTLNGLFEDQAALFGTLNMINNLNLTLISVVRAFIKERNICAE